MPPSRRRDRQCSPLVKRRRNVGSAGLFTFGRSEQPSSGQVRYSEKDTHREAKHHEPHGPARGARALPGPGRLRRGQRGRRGGRRRRRVAARSSSTARRPSQPLTAAAGELFRGGTRASTSRSAPPAPAAGSRSSARARPTSPTPPARSRTRRSRSARRTASSTPSSRSPPTR